MMKTTICLVMLGGILPVASAQPTVYYTDTVADTINRIDPDGSNQTTLVSGFGTNINGITAAQGQMFWTDISEDAVFSAGLDGSSPGVFLDLSVLDGLIFATDITNDGQNVYFSDGAFEERLFRSPISSPSLEQIGSNIDIDGLEADPNAGFLYLFDFNEVFRSNLDGTGFTTIIGGLPGVDALTVDPGTNTLFYLVDGVIFSANGDGSSIESVFDLSLVPDYGQSLVSDTAFFDDVLYWIEAGDSDGIWSLDLTDPEATPTQILAQVNIGNLTVVPGPGTLSLLGLGGLAALRRRR